MKASTFWSTLGDIQAASGHDKRDYIVEHLDDDDAVEFVSFLAGEPFIDPEQKLGVAKKSVRKAAEQAFNWNPREREKGNLSEALIDPPRPNTLFGEPVEPSLIDIHNLLVDVSETSGSNAKIDLIADRFTHWTHPQVVSYCLLDDISVGVGEKSIVACFSQKWDFDFDRAYGIFPHPGEVLDLFLRDRLRLKLQPFDRFQPMLASSKDIDDDFSKWVAQTKYDGARVLIHRRGDQIRVFSRDRKEVTESLPEITMADWPDVDFIVDGEAIARHPETNEVMDFQHILKRFRREHDIEEAQNSVAVDVQIFDVLFWKREVTALSYKERHRLLEENLPDRTAAVYHDPDQAYDDALKHGHEGIIAKRVTAEYQYDRSMDWRKKKPVKEPVELIVRNVIEGENKYDGMLGAIEVMTSDGTPLGNVGTGFSDAEREQLWQQRDELRGSVVQIEFEELQESDGEYGLRFPRYDEIRPEGQADSLERLKDL